MRSLILVVFLSLLLAAPVVSMGDFILKLGGVPAQIEEGRSITVGIRVLSLSFIEPDNVRINGTSITIGLFYWGCPILCEPQLYDYEIPLGQLPAGEYTVEAEIGGSVVGTLEFEVVG